MFARVTEFRGPIQALDRAGREVEELLPSLRALDGFAGVIVMGDRETGRVVTLTLWDDQNAMEASEEAAAAIRSESASENDQEIVGIDRFEVFVEAREGGR